MRKLGAEIREENALTDPLYLKQQTCTVPCGDSQCCRDVWPNHLPAWTRNPAKPRSRCNKCTCWVVFVEYMDPAEASDGVYEASDGVYEASDGVYEARMMFSEAKLECRVKRCRSWRASPQSRLRFQVRQKNRHMQFAEGCEGRRYR